MGGAFVIEATPTNCCTRCCRVMDDDAKTMAWIDLFTRLLDALQDFQTRVDDSRLAAEEVIERCRRILSQCETSLDHQEHPSGDVSRDAVIKAKQDVINQLLLADCVIAKSQEMRKKLHGKDTMETPAGATAASSGKCKPADRLQPRKVPAAQGVQRVTRRPRSQSATPLGAKAQGESQRARSSSRRSHHKRCMPHAGDGLGRSREVAITDDLRSMVGQFVSAVDEAKQLADVASCPGRQNFLSKQVGFTPFLLLSHWFSLKH